MKNKIKTFKSLSLYFLSLAKSFGIFHAFHIVWMQFFKTVRYKHEYILSYLESNYSNVINKYKGKSQNVGLIAADCTVWVCWFQGEDSMPETIRYCFESIKMHSKGRKVQLITFENYAKFISLPDYIEEKVKKGIISLTHFSDIIRCNLLADHGGIYIDAGLLLTADLQIPELSFFSIKKRRPENDYSFVSEYRWVAGFMAGAQGNLLHLFMKNFFNEYHNRENMLLDYFLVDYVIALAYNNYPDVKKMIDAVPYNNEECYYIQDHLFEPLKLEELNSVLSNTSVFRIGYKGIPQIINENSLYNYLFKQDNSI